MPSPTALPGSTRRIVPASKYTDVRGALTRGGTVPQGVGLFLPRHAVKRKPTDWEAFWERNMRPGGLLRNMFIADQHRTARELPVVAKHMQGFRQNKKCDFELICTTPAITWHRWNQQEPGLWHDEKAIRKLAGQNPEMESWKHF